MQENKRRLGSAYERVAGAYLVQRGYKILEYNYRCRFGEIDIIAEQGGYLVFCEVKYRKNQTVQHPLEAVDFLKQRTISRCAGWYMLAHEECDRPCRFDVVGILGQKISLVQNAFEYVE